MKKHLFTLFAAIMCMLLLAIFVSAEAYTVSDNDGYNEAYEKAVNGDTIIINSKLTCDIYASKSITYILKADWESSKLVVDTSNVEVSFIADGGNYKIMPTNYSTTDGWMNISKIYENVVINLGGKNGGTLTIDGSNATHDRVSYVPALVEDTTYYSNVFPDICLNLLSGSAIANFNTTTKDDNVNSCLLYAKTVNMYDGCQIYANSVISAPLIKSCFFNLYGGEIFGNLLTSIRMGVNGVGFIYADKRFDMYGGRIYNNIFNAKNGPYQFNVVGFISTNQGYYGARAVVYGGELGDRYTSGKGNYEVSAIVGVYTKDNGATCFYYNTGVTAGTRYIFTDTPQLTLDQSTGKIIWKVSQFQLDSANNYGFSWNHTKKPGSKVAVFLDAEKKTIAGSNFDTYTVINAYIDGVYAHSGETTIAIPSGYALWSTSGTEYCHTGKTYTLNEVLANSITLYSAYEAEIVTINGTVACSGCGKVFSCNNPDHEHEILSIHYDSYDAEGEKTIKCNTCDVVNSFSAPALFTCLGYSAPENGKNGIALGYTVNNKAIEDFEVISESTINYGIFAVLKDRLGSLPIFSEDGTPANGVISADITSYECVAFDLKVTGFTDEYKTAKIAMGAYVATKNGETIEYTYIQGGDISENEKYHFASYYDAIALIPDEIVEFEDISIKAGEEITLPSTVNINGTDREISYSFEGESISIENNVLKGLVEGSETIVTVTGENITGAFKVEVESDKYKYVVVIGVDGAGAFFKNAETPNIDAIFANGAITYDCLTANPTISAQCWGSLLHGVVPSVHGLTNSVVASTAYPSNSKYPSFFRVIKENNENAILASFCNWNPINVGIIENDIGVHKVGGISDSELTNEILAYLEGNNPTALFVQFDEADGAGHSYGYGTANQLAKIKEIDGYIGRIYEAYKQNGILDETLFIVTSDHGGSGTSHGGLSDAEKYVMFAAAGKNVQNGTIVDIEIRDTAAIVLHALGYENPETWTARVPSGLFEGVVAGDRPVYVDKESDRYHETVPTPEQGSEGYVTNYIKDHALNTYLTFDGNITNSCGGTTAQGGNLYFVEDGYFGNGVALDDGYVTLNNFAPGASSFTIALWINTKAITSDPCIISNKNWASGNNLGFTLTIRSSGVALNIGNGSTRVDCVAALPADYTEGWMHVVAFIDRTSNKIGVCLDFGTIVTADISAELQGVSVDTNYKTNIGQDGTGKYNVSLPATIDELMIFGGAFDQSDVASLKAYYGITNN